jgi:hypothetical protein
MPVISIKASPALGSVLMEADGFPVQPYSDCAIQDSENWRCGSVTMIGGKDSYLSTRTDISLLQMPKWKWALLHYMDKVPFTTFRP